MDNGAPDRPGNAAEARQVRREKPTAPRRGGHGRAGHDGVRAADQPGGGRPG